MAQNRLVRLSEIAGEEKPVVAPVIGPDIELHQRRAENVSGVEKFKRDARRDLARLVHVNRSKELHQQFDVLLVVKRLEQFLAVAAAALVDVFKVALLQEARIAQHHAAKFHSRLPRENPPAETLARQLRQVAGMVDVGVG